MAVDLTTTSWSPLLDGTGKPRPNVPFALSIVPTGVQVVVDKTDQYGQFPGSAATGKYVLSVDGRTRTVDVVDGGDVNTLKNTPADRARELGFADSLDSQVGPTGSWSPTTLKTWVTVRQGYERVRVSANVPLFYVGATGDTNVYLYRDVGTQIDQRLISGLVAATYTPVKLERELDLTPGEHSFYVVFTPPAGTYAAYVSNPGIASWVRAEEVS